MPKYRVHLVGSASATIDVEAEDAESAVDEAYAEGTPGICAQCCGWGRSWSQEWPDDMQVFVDDDGKEAVDLVEE
ncbi:hypothetical protein ACFXJ8_26145 [Nonomuraea sp. NPDC059194]|uniref:hypothetical protein n=1 Tax=Nonomuraea sp. NPDC059194 TaxID=3346764 RepID=UPI003675783E